MPGDDVSPSPYDTSAEEAAQEGGGSDSPSENGASQTPSVAKEHAPGESPQSTGDSEADAFLRNVTASLDLAAVFLDTDLRVKHFTPRATEVFELASADLGKSFSRVAGAVDDQLYSDARRVLNTGNSVRREVKTDDSWYVMRVLPYRTDQKDGLDGVVMRFFDITDRKRTEEELRESEVRLRLLMENLDEYAIFTLDGEGKITSWNAAAGKLFQYAEREVLGRVGKILYSAEDRDEGVPQQRLDEARQAGQSRDYRWMVRKDGSRFWAYSVTVALYDNDDRMRGYARVVRDVSERKRSAEKLARAKEESDIAQAEAERARQRAEQSRVEAERASEAKSQFLANMSHELRTPLNSIIGYSDMILADIDEEEETMASDLRRILSSGRHLLSLVNDVLDLSKIEAGRMELNLTDFDVAPVVQETADAVRPRIEENGSQLKVECEEGLPEMHADETKLRQSLNNLLSNAAKFTENGTVAVRARRERREGHGGVAFEVADTGIGMTEEEQEDLFEAFEQASEETSHEYGGTGLGLAITRNMCRLMGGDIELESEKGVGSTFTIWLPEQVREGREGVAPGMRSTPSSAEEPSSTSAGAASTTSPATSAEQTSAPVNDTVLVIDDDPDVRQLLKRHLNAKGFVVETASSGAEGLRMARQLQPLAITLDVRMPDMDGWEVLSYLQEDDRIDDEVNVIMLTIVDDGERGYRLGADDYLTKPVDQEKLATLLERYRSSVEEGPVLIVEDDEHTRDLLRRTLESEGHAVMEAADGREGLDRLEEDVPGLVILDLMMPEVDGFEFLEAMRREKQYHEVPVVVVTAKELGVEERRYLSRQVDETLKKSEYTRAQLLSEVEARLDAARNEQQEGASQPAGDVQARSAQQETEPSAGASTTPTETTPTETTPTEEISFAEEGSQESGAGKGGGDTVLVIDDDPDVRRLLNRRLTDHGFQVETVSNGPEGLRRARRLNPLAITLDVRMPDMDGWETLALLRDDDRVDDDVHIIMITIADEGERGYRLGADDFLTKPVERGKLVTLLERYRGDVEEGTVLVVEDDENTRDLLKRTLENEGYEVCEAADGREGLKCLEENEPGLVLLDLMMPKMDGFEFLEVLREDEAHRDVPVVVITAKEMDDEERRYLSRQVDETLKKSEYTRAQLLSEVEARLDAVRKKQHDGDGQSSSGQAADTAPARDETTPAQPDRQDTTIAEEVSSNGAESDVEADLQAALDESTEDLKANGSGEVERLEETAGEAVSADDKGVHGETDAKEPEEEQKPSQEETSSREGEASQESAAASETPAARKRAAPPEGERTEDESSPVEESSPVPSEEDAAPERADAGVRDAATGEESPIILLVEDNEHNYNMLSRRLRRRGYEVELATDGQTGLDKAESVHPDLILMDINLPVLNGKKATRRIRSFPEGSDVPIIALTAHAMTGDREEALEAGCDQYHSKPVDLPDLLGQIEELLEA